MTGRITSQAVGAFGERAVESELLRCGWIVSNVNMSVRNAADFDLIALKNGRAVQLRVKTCGPGMDAFQFSFRRPHQISGIEFSPFDFTILVRMGDSRADDHFYVLPTPMLRRTIETYRELYLSQARRDGNPRVDAGHWTLHLVDLKSGEERVNYGLAAKWAPYRDNWSLLETSSNTIDEAALS